MIAHMNAPASAPANPAASPPAPRPAARNRRPGARPIRARLLAWCGAVCLLLCLLASPPAARAQDDAETNYDARLHGFVTRTGEPVKVHVNKDSTATTWLLFLFVGVVGMAALFKNAKRTHLD